MLKFGSWEHLLWGGDHREHPDRRQIWEHLGRVAGRFDALGMGDVVDHATPQHPDRRDLTVGAAVNALGLKGLGCSHQALSLVPRGVHNAPTDRLSSPRVAPAPLHDDALGRAVETPYDYGGTARYRLLATTAATRLGLAPRVAPLARTSVPVDGRDTREEEPDAEGRPSPRGYRREHRPDLPQGRRAWRVEPQAGLPLLRPPRKGHRRAAQAFGQGLQEPLAPVPTTAGLPARGADRAW